MSTAKKSWAEEEVEDSNDIKEVVEYKIKEGKKYKITKKVKTVKKAVKTPKGVDERKRWKKFGLAQGSQMNEDVQITCERGEEVFFERTGAAVVPTIQSDEVQMLDKIKTQLNAPTGEVKSSGAYRPPGTRTESEPTRPSTPTLGGGEGKYVPPSERNRLKEGGSSHADRDQAATVRVSNLSDMITDSDLRNVFGKIGPIERSYLAMDRNTRQSKGFAFITYDSRDDAQKAIEKLNGFRWDYLVISVEWAKAL
jgi:translation initiation factor 3 subunit G